MPRLALSLVAALLMCAPASAAGPQKGRYECWFTEGFFTADLHILAKKKYSVDGDQGKYKVDGKKLKMKSGPHKGLWRKVTWSTKPDLYGEPRSAILFYPKKEGATLLQCVRLD